MHGVRRCRCHPGRNRPGLGDTFLQQLAITRFLVGQQRTCVFRLVALPLRRVDADLAEQTGHAEGARLVGHYRHHPRPQLRRLEPGAEHAHGGHGGGHFLALGLQGEAAHGLQGGHRHRAHVTAPGRQRATQGGATLAQVTHFRAAFGRPIELQLLDLRIRQRQMKTITERQQGLHVEFLGLVRGHPRLTGGAHAVAFLGLGQNDRRPALAGLGGGEGGIQLAKVVATALERVDLGRTHVLDQFLQGRLLIEKVLEVVGAILGPEVLELPVGCCRQLTQQYVLGVTGEQCIPLRTPEHLDHVPASATEQRFQFLDDLAVASHRAVQALQVAVDHERQVIQLLAGGQGQAGNGLRLVHLAIAEHAPNMPGAGVEQLAVMQITHEPRLVDGVDRPDAHGAGRELPEVGHQPWVWIRTQAVACHFLAVAGQLLFAQAAFEKGPGINARCRMRLEKHQVSRTLFSARFAAKEMLEADFEDLRCRRVTGDMPTQVAIGVVGPHYHGQGIPAQDAGDAFIEFEVARVDALLLHRQGVAIGRKGLGAAFQAQLTSVGFQLFEQKPRTLRAAVQQGRIQRLQPLGGFPRVAVQLWITQAPRHTFARHKVHHCHHCIDLVREGFRRRP
ncbi:hypothetical protein D3C77_219840 [compost metagenome]